MTATDPVAVLLENTDVAPGSGSDVNWVAVEGSLGGRALPRDYKKLIENFPLGRFKGSITVIRPGQSGGSPDEYLGYFASRLNDYRGWRDAGHGNYPYPLFPEPEGLLPWGFKANGDLVFWLTRGDDSDRWPIVTCDHQQTEWRVYDQGMAEFLVDLLRDPPAAIAQAPAFLPDRPASSAQAQAYEPIGYSATRRPPRNRADELVAAVGATPPARGHHDWELISRVFGTSIPADYRAFYDAVGAGIFCDMVIFGPEAPSPLTLADLLRATRARRAQTRGAELILSLHPDPDGWIPWGATTDGAWTYVWDPKTWGVGAVDLGFRSVQRPDVSFSDFLLHYAEGDDLLYLGNPRKWTSGPTFQRIP